jgi:hypothetical protein
VQQIVSKKSFEIIQRDQINNLPVNSSLNNNIDNNIGIISNSNKISTHNLYLIKLIKDGDNPDFYQNVYVTENILKRKLNIENLDAEIIK